MSNPVIRIKVLQKPQIRGKMDVRFPAKVEAENFLTVTRENGVYTFGVDYSVLPPGPISDATTAYVAVLDQTSSSYRVVTLASLLTSGLDADLQAIAELTGTGILARTADDTWTLRAITGTANEITITDGDGVSGTPTVSLPSELTFTGKTVTGGTFDEPEINSPTGIVKGDVGLGNVDNTSDADKPISDDTQTALDGKQTLDATLTALAALDATAGLLTQTGADTFVRRSLAAPAAGITITNPAGTTGNPTLALANDLAAVEGLSTTGIVRRTGTDAFSAGTAVANSELATMVTATFKGNVSGSTAAPSDLTAAQVTAALPVATTSAKGLAPTLPNDATKYLDGTGNFSVPAGGGGGGGPSSYLGVVATRCFIPQGIGGAGAQNCMARSRHIARDSITSLQLVYANWLVKSPSTVPTGTGEVANTTSLQYRAAIEYPAGTFTQVLFSGSATGTATAGNNLISDAVSVTIPDGAPFWVRTFVIVPGPNQTPWSGTFGMYANSIVDLANGEAFAAGSGITDVTLGGTITDGFSGQINIYPAAIIGNTTKPSVMVLGDSISLGVTDAVDFQGDTGTIARTIGPYYGYINASVPGERAQNVASTFTKRLGLAAYASSVVVTLGANDVFSAGSSASAVQGFLSTIWTAFESTNRKVFQTTITPVSTGSFSSLSGQTLPTGAANRAPINAFIRSLPAPLSGVLNVADVYEPWRNAGTWDIKVSNTTTLIASTPDGIHPASFTYGWVEKHGVIPVRLFDR